jgi:hypothetical protein
LFIQLKIVAVNLKVNTEIGLFPANVKTTEVIVSDLNCHLPISFAAKLAKHRYDQSLRSLGLGPES